MYYCGENNYTYIDKNKIHNNCVHSHIFLNLKKEII